MTILHSVNLAQPAAEMALTHKREDGGQSGALKHVRVGNLVLSLYAEYASEAAQVETIQSLLLGSVYCPSFTGVEECAQDAGSVQTHLGFRRQIFVGSHPFVELGHDC